MFDIGWTEMVVVVVLAIIVIGPKDLPKLIRTIGQWTGRARALAREFQSSIDDIAKEAELDEIKKGIETATKFDIKKEIENSIDPTGGGLVGGVDPSEPAKSSDGGGEANGPDSAASEPDATLVEPEVMQSELDAKQAEWAAAAAPPHSVIPPEDPFADRPSADADAPEAAETPAPAEPATAADDETDAGASVKSGVGG